MRTKKQFPTIESGQLRGQKALQIVTEHVEGLVYNLYPVFQIKAAKGINLNNPPLNSRDKSLIGRALLELGFNAGYKLTFPSSIRAIFGSGPDEGPHLDDKIPYINEAYDADDYMIMRRHTGAVKAARVTMTHAKVISAEFRRSNDAPVYEGEQMPGDRLIFVSIGGIIGEHVIKPAYHNFVSLEPSGINRAANIADYVFRPQVEF